MTIEEIRKGAPKDSDFYVIDGDRVDYYRCYSGFWYIFSGKWIGVNSLRIQDLRDHLRRIK